MRNFLAIFCVILTAAISPSKSFAQEVETQIAPDIVPLEIKGQFIQSGLIIGKTTPGSLIEYQEEKIIANKDGVFLIGFDRDDQGPAIFKIFTPYGLYLEKSFEIVPRQYEVTEVNGLPPAKVNPPDSVLARIAKEKEIKNAAWASLDETARGFEEVFRYPLANVRTTSSWGAVRSLNGTKGVPHYGVDYGAKTGTPVFAAASGKVVIAKSGFYYEGGLVGIDHGQGLISYYMHLSKITTLKGKWVKKGQKIGEVGATGRATGPHLHWALRWRNRQLDPQLLTKSLMPIEIK